MILFYIILYSCYCTLLLHLNKYEVLNILRDKWENLMEEKMKLQTDDSYEEFKATLRSWQYWMTML